MALFPASPTNGQTTVVNGITYTYNSSQTAWIRTGTTITQGDLSVNGNIIATGNVSANYFTGNGSQLTGITASAGNSIVNGTSNVKINTSGGNVTTSVGGTSNVLVITGTGANVTGTFNVSGISTLGPNSNVNITGGTANYALITDGLGNLSWSNPASQRVRTVTTSNTLLATDQVVLVNSANSVTITLPLATATLGNTFAIKNIGTGQVTVQCSGADTLDGAANIIIRFQYSAFDAYSVSAGIYSIF